MDRVVLNVAMGPHIHDGSRSSHIMHGYLLALIPAALFGCYRYGMPGIRVLLLAIGSAVVFEWLSRLSMKRDICLHDSSALVHGLILGMILPPNTAWWMVIGGVFVTIILAKQIFGGIGCYPFHPVMIGAALLMVSWPMRMSPHFSTVNMDLPGMILEPLSALKTYGPDITEIFSSRDLFIGNHMSGIGTGSTVFLGIGGLYLLVRGFIAWRVCISYFVGIYGTAWIFHQVNPGSYADPVFHLLSGLTVFAGVFIISDYTVTPVNKIARILYGLIAGILIILIRNIGAYPDGTIFAVLILNLFHPLLDRIKKPVMGLDAAALKLPE